MTSPRREHARYDELAAGYALHALDPRDAADFAAHLPGCPRCQDTADRFFEVTAALADTCPPAEPGPALGHRIMAAVSAIPPAGANPAHPSAAASPAAVTPADPAWADRGPAAVTPADRGPAAVTPADPAWADRGPAAVTPADPAWADRGPAAVTPADPAWADRGPAAVTPADPAWADPAWADPAMAGAAPTDLLPARTRRQAAASHRRTGGRRPLRIVAAGIAAAAALIAGGATVAGLSGGGPSGPVPPAANCARASTCREVVLTAAGSHAPAARLIISGGTAWLVPSGLPADNRSRQVYVLWQITGAHTPLPVGSFDVPRHGESPIRVGPLAVPYRGTWAFAVSLEHGRTIPATPSRPVALGPVPS
jgi:hypothetical protein